MVKIYNISEKIDEKVIIDTDVIDGVDFKGNFHYYLFKFPKHKVLVYNYLKYTEEPVKISNLHKMFYEFSDINYFRTVVHKRRMEVDMAYRRVYLKYVKGQEEFWVNGPNRYNSYIFDSKYLRFGEYQKIVAEGMKNAGAIYTHIAGMMSYTRTLDLKETSKKMEIFLEDKKNIEKRYFDDLLGTFNKIKPDYLHAYGYSNFIEIYDTTSELLFRVTLIKDNFHEYKMLFPTKKKNKEKKVAVDLGINFIIKQISVAQLLNKLTNDIYRRKTNDYLKELDRLKSSDECKIYKNSISIILEDLKNNNPSAHLKNKAQAIHVRDGIIEKNIINISEQNNLVRLQRNIHINKLKGSEPIILKSYFLMGNFDQVAEQLIMEDFLNIHPLKHVPDMLEYQLISERKFPSSKMFLKEPIKDILLENLYDYETIQQSLDAEIETYIMNDEEIPNKVNKIEKGEYFVMNELRYYRKNGKIPEKYNINIPLFKENQKIAKKLNKVTD